MRADYVMALVWCGVALLNSTTFIGFICVAIAAYHAREATKRIN